MALQPVMPLRTIVDQVLMERWRARQPIVRASCDCDCTVALYRRDEGYCGEPTKAFRLQRPLRIQYERGLSNAERYAHLCDTPTTKAKLLSEKATKSRATHLIRANRHRPTPEDTKSSGE
jgi:hypothetical protein